MSLADRESVANLSQRKEGKRTQVSLLRRKPKRKAVAGQNATPLGVLTRHGRVQDRFRVSLEEKLSKERLPL